MNLNLSALECVKVYADLLRKTIRLLTEIVHSPLGVSFFCRFYKKGTFSLNGKKFDFCKITQIIVSESINKEKRSYGNNSQDQNSTLERTE